jgi:hypothetical protein
MQDRRERNREKLLAFARQRIADDHRDHDTVSPQKIAREYEAEQDRNQRQTEATAITVGNTP